MAIVRNNLYTLGLSGRVGNTLLYRQYGNKTVVGVFPRPITTPPSARQLAQRKKFALAVLNTRQWLATNTHRHFLEGLARKWGSVSAYHAGVRYFMHQQTVVGTQKATGKENPEGTTTATSPANAGQKQPGANQQPGAQARKDGHNSS